MQPFQEKFFNVAALIADELKSNPELPSIVSTLKHVREEGKRLFIIGSGGGAGHASHAACDFRKLAGMNVCCPTDNVSELTARINDDGWENSISGILKGMKMEQGDALMVFSVGGGDSERNISANLVNAIDYARAVGAIVIGIVGRECGHAAKYSDHCIVVPAHDPSLLTPMAESFQALVWHYLVSHPDLQVQQAKWESQK